MMQAPASSLSAAASFARLMQAALPFRRVQLAVTLVLTLTGALAELCTIGAVLPVLAIAARPESMTTLPLVGPALAAWAGFLDVGPVIAATALLTAAAVAATLLRLALLWTTQKFVFGLQHDLSMEVFNRALHQPYSWYLEQNSSVLIASQQKITLISGGVIMPLLQAFTAGLMALVMTAFLFVLDPRAAFVASASIGMTYLGITFYARRKVDALSDGLSAVYSERVQTMQETLGGMRDINLDQSQGVFRNRWQRVEERHRRMGTAANFLATAPRLVVEGVTIVLVAVMAAWFSVQDGGVLAALPVLGALALGAQRMLPMIQMIYQGWSQYSVYKGNVRDVIELLDAPMEANSPIAAHDVRRFTQDIELRDLEFRYGAAAPVLRHVNVTIAKGERIGIIGKTGSGKSTLVDIVMGLLMPTRGALVVDGEVIDAAAIGNWKAQIAHVPQAIFLSDDSIGANIAFGVPEAEVDPARVLSAAREAGLGELIEDLSEGLATGVGERGIRLSGGQRQRIGIARALYKRATVLVLDEATSALDDETEAAVMQSVARLDRDLTVILIAHRLSTVANCDRVYRLGGGRIVAQGSYEEVTGKASAAS